MLLIWQPAHIALKSSVLRHLWGCCNSDPSCGHGAVHRENPSPVSYDVHTCVLMLVSQGAVLTCAGKWRCHVSAPAADLAQRSAAR